MEAAGSFGGGGGTPSSRAVHLGQIRADLLFRGGFRRGRLNDDGEFAAEHFEPLNDFGCAASQHLFVDLGELTAERDEGVVEIGSELGEGCGDAIGAFEEDEDARIGGRIAETPDALGSLPRKESEEMDVGAFEAGDGERGDESRRPGHGEDGDSGLMCCGDEPCAGIGDDGRTRLADESDGGVFCRFDQLRCACSDVMLCEADSASVAFCDFEDTGAGAGVFGGNDTRRGEDLAGAGGEVLEVADWGGDDIKAGWEIRHGNESAEYCT